MEYWMKQKDLVECAMTAVRSLLLMSMSEDYPTPSVSDDLYSALKKLEEVKIKTIKENNVVKVGNKHIDKEV